MFTTIICKYKMLYNKKLNENCFYGLVVVRQENGKTTHSSLTKTERISPEQAIKDAEILALELKQKVSGRCHIITDDGNVVTTTPTYFKFR